MKKFKFEQQEQFNKFIKTLTDAVHVVFVSNPKLIHIVSTDVRTGVYVKNIGSTITVLMETGKQKSLKAVA